MIFNNLSTWGWLLLISAWCCMATVLDRTATPYGRLLGVFSASVNAMILLFTVNALPDRRVRAHHQLLVDPYGLVLYKRRHAARQALRLKQF